MALHYHVLHKHLVHICFTRWKISSSQSSNRHTHPLNAWFAYIVRLLNVKNREQYKRMLGSRPVLLHLRNFMMWRTPLHSRINQPPRILRVEVLRVEHLKVPALEKHYHLPFCVEIASLLL